MVPHPDDSGPGRLRAAGEAGGPPIVLCRVAGIIARWKPSIVTLPVLTVAGQSAPGDGVCLHDAASASPPTPSWCGPRCRLGNVNRREEDCLELLTGAHDCSLDHGSATGSIDEGLSCPTRRPPAHALDAHDAAAATGVNPKTGCTPLEDSLNRLAAEKS